MSDKTALGTRMKDDYEKRTRQYLTRRTATIIRLDGKAFHTYTKGLDKPFDEGLIEDMSETTKFLCENIMGVKCGYTQSDEISLLLWDADKYETQAWFDGQVQKMVSIASSLATAKFNQLRITRELNRKKWDKSDMYLISSGETLAFFDARVFQLPNKEEVVNYFIWRQRDAVKNSVAMLAQSLYSHKELFKKNGSDMQEMCFQKGHNWNDLHFSKKRGSFILKNKYIDGVLYDDDIIINTGDKGKNEYAKWNVELNDYVALENPKVRNKWESWLTPDFSKNKELITKLY